MVGDSPAAPPTPLIEGKSGPTCIGPPVYPLTCFRRCCIVAAWLVFVVLLLYGSGFGLLVATILQQSGHLSTDPNILFVLFPTAYGKIKVDGNGFIDLINQNYLLMAIPWWVASMAWEAFMMFVVYPPSHRPLHVYRVNDSISSLSTGILYLLVANLAFLSWGKALYRLIHTHLRFTDLFQDPLSPATWWFSLFASDLFYYLGHRSSHYFSWMWMDHSVHHSSEEYNLSTALRQPANSFLTPEVFIFTLPLALLFPPELAFFQGQVGLLYQFWIHTQLIPPLPKIEMIFNTASLHRIHHARNLRALGKNYGSIFSFFDRIGGTFEPEFIEEAEPLYYGIIPPLNSWDPLWANLSHLHYMFTRQCKWHGWKTPFVHWTPPNGRCPRLGSRLNSYEKFNVAPTTFVTHAYVLLEFMIALLAVIAMSFVPLPSTWKGKWNSIVNSVFFVVILVSLVCVASIESAQTRRALTRAVAADCCRQVVVVALAVLLSYRFLEGSIMLVVYASIGAYAAVHGCCLIFLFLYHRSEARIAGTM